MVSDGTEDDVGGVAAESGCASGAACFALSVPLSCARAGPMPATSSSKHFQSPGLATSIRVTEAPPLRR
jgi:hypothetical protein